jgi:hypothetical protein
MLECQRRAIRSWKARNREKVLASNKRYHEANKDEINRKNKIFREKNRERLRAYTTTPEFRAKRRAHRAKHPEQYRKAENEYRLRNPGPWQLKTARKRARLAGLDFDLDHEWFNERLVRGCELSGLPFERIKRSPNLPSIDRINHKGPYTKANCRLILWWLNRALSNLGDDYAIKVFQAVIAKRHGLLPYTNEGDFKVGYWPPFESVNSHAQV